MYTEASLRAELALIYRNPDEKFQWEAKESGPVTLDDVVRYCWVAYDKARHASGPQVIGRSWDLHGSLRKEIANLVKDSTLHDAGTRGNILQMDKWSLVMNDCWLLGGIHRQATFQVMSMPTWQNVWSPSLNSFVVTARELIGLRIAGYERQIGPAQRHQDAVYVPRNEAAAMAACLEDYHLEVALRETRGPLGATDLVT